MALIKCKECGTEISDKAKTCVKCGAPVSTFISDEKAGFGCLVVIFLIGMAAWYFWPASGNKSTVSNASVTQAADVSSNAKIQVEQIYTSRPGNLMCATEQGLIDAIRHAAAGETTLFQRMLVSNGGQCMEFPGGVRIKVIQVDAKPFAGHALVKFTPEDAPNANGVWAGDALVLPPSNN